MRLGRNAEVGASRLGTADLATRGVPRLAGMKEW